MSSSSAHSRGSVTAVLILTLCLSSASIVRAEESTAITPLPTPTAQPVPGPVPVQASPAGDKVKATPVSPSPSLPASLPAPPQTSLTMSNEDKQMHQRLVRGAVVGGMLGFALSAAAGYFVPDGGNELIGLALFGVSSFVTVPLGAALGLQVAGRGYAGHGSMAMAFHRGLLFTILYGGLTCGLFTLLTLAGGEPTISLAVGVAIAGIVNLFAGPAGAFRGYRKSAAGMPASSKQTTRRPLASSFALRMPSAQASAWGLNWTSQF